MVRITNNAAGLQGVRSAGGRTVYLKPGETRDVDLAEDAAEQVGRLPFLKIEWASGGTIAPVFQRLVAEDRGSVIAVPTNPFDAMSDDELRAIVESKEGKRPHPKTGRAKLLARAMEA